MSSRLSTSETSTLNEAKIELLRFLKKAYRTVQEINDRVTTNKAYFIKMYNFYFKYFNIVHLMKCEGKNSVFMLLICFVKNAFVSAKKK